MIEVDTFSARRERLTIYEKMKCCISMWPSRVATFVAIISLHIVITRCLFMVCRPRFRWLLWMSPGIRMSCLHMLCQSTSVHNKLITSRVRILDCPFCELPLLQKHDQQLRYNERRWWLKVKMEGTRPIQGIRLSVHWCSPIHNFPLSPILALMALLENVPLSFTHPHNTYLKNVHHTCKSKH